MLHILPRQNYQRGTKSSNTGACGGHFTSKPQRLWAAEASSRQEERISSQEVSQQRVRGMDRTQSSLRRMVGGKLAATAGL